MADEEGKELTVPTLIRREWYQERWSLLVLMSCYLLIARTQANG